ncbi:MAG TPA: transglutaminase-like domain-containing protein, partial [Polyangiaceae bacterium]|nr:transglutaminase-like domain-containing protein [Polyangiaceae bacterium]
ARNSPRNAARGGNDGDAPNGDGDTEGDAPLPSSGAPYSIDSDTSRPERVSYADPFTPTVVPFKRGVVFDSVNADGDLLVRDPQLVEVPTLGAPRPDDETFHASFELDLRPGERVPLPSVAPGAQLVLINRDPRVPLSIGADSAENWFVTAKVSRHVRLTLQIAADRRVFGSDYPDVNWPTLATALPPVPPPVKQSALDVARALGIEESARPQRAVAALVEHFRRFSPSERRPQSHGLALYRELALTARGICRHRAYAFMITALGLGIPTRVAINEAHAWVEVYDGELWHRIDLGGAASELDMDDPGRPRHVEPRDPFSWPDKRESGLAMAERRFSTSDAPAAPDAPVDPEAPASGTEPPLAPATPPPLPFEPPTAPGDDVPNDPQLQPAPPPVETPPPPSSDVHLQIGAARAERGKSLFVSGNARGEKRPCSGARIDVLLGQPSGDPIALGSLVTDPRGDFRGYLVIPWNAALGEHGLFATASGCR